MLTPLVTDVEPVPYNTFVDNSLELMSVTSKELEPSENIKLEEVKEPNKSSVNNGPTFKLGGKLITRLDSVETNVTTNKSENGLHKSALLRKLTTQYIVALALIGVAFAPSTIVSWTIYTGSTSFLVLTFVGGRQLQHQIALASERLYLVTQTTFLARECNFTATSKELQNYRSTIQDNVNTLSQINNDLLFSYGKLNTAQNEFEFSTCLYSDKQECNDPDDPNSTWVSNGLNLLLERYLEVISLFIYST